MSATRAAGRGSSVDEAHDDAVERRALRETRSSDRARSEEYVQGQRDQRQHDQSTSQGRRDRRARPAAKGARKAGRQVKRSAVGQVGTAAFSAAGLFGVALSLVALYLMLTSAETVAQVIQLARRSLHWLASPTKSIPYGKEA